MGRGLLSDQERGELDELYKAAEAGDHYALLGIEDEAESDAIQEAYYSLSRQWHPDRHFRRDLGDYADHLNFIFIQITKAYKTLSNPDSRRRHDRGAKATRAEEPHTEATVSPEAPSDQPYDPDETTDAKPRKKARGSDRSRAFRALRKQARGRASRAKRYFDQGKTDYEEGRITKAVSSLHLACQFDPKNKEYRTLYKQVQMESRAEQVDQLVQAGANAEQFQNFREAISHYERAIELDPDDGLPFHRLARLVKRFEDDPRRAVSYLRQAVTKSPDNIEFRLDLGDIYLEIGMGLNARREFQAVLRRDRKNTRAKAGLKNA